MSAKRPPDPKESARTGLYERVQGWPDEPVGVWRCGCDKILPESAAKCSKCRTVQPGRDENR